MARLRIALLIESSRSFGRNLLYGIAAYSRTYGPWTFYHQERSIDDPLPASLRHWRPDGIIARTVDLRRSRQLHRLSVPTIELYHVPPGGVKLDHEAIVRLAAEHDGRFQGCPRGQRRTDHRRRLGRSDREQHLHRQHDRQRRHTDSEQQSGD
jgi:hypothetical protein